MASSNIQSPRSNTTRHTCRDRRNPSCSRKFPCIAGKQPWLPVRIQSSRSPTGRNRPYLLTDRPREKSGRSPSLKANDPISLSVDQLTNTDDFDQWVNGKIESGQAATVASQQYTGIYDYSSGFGDLYTYGGWYSIAGFGYCWRPYGVSLGWNPFQMGNWYYDPGLGTWIFIGSQPWGWLPYHYGGWVFHPGYGWVWNPRGPGNGGAFPYARSGSIAMARGGSTWRPVTGTWVKSGNSVALVPTHPMDIHGKEPINLKVGVFPVSSRGVSDPVQANAAENWKNLHKGPGRDFLPMESAGSTPPARVVRTMAGGGSSAGVVAVNRESGIAYDPAEHRFVNNPVMRFTDRTGAGSTNAAAMGGRETEQTSAGNRNSDMRRGNTEIPGTRNTSATNARGAMPPSARSSTPPPPNPGARGGNSSSAGGSRWGGSSSGSSSGPSRSSWGGSSSSSSSSSSSRPSSSSSGSSSGGRPH